MPPHSSHGPSGSVGAAGRWSTAIVYSETVADLHAILKGVGESRTIHCARRVTCTISPGAHRRMRGPQVPVPRDTITGMLSIW